MKIIYTEAAEQEILNFHQQQKELLESLIAEKKVVFGDDVLEITASDIKDASRKIQVLRPISLRYSNVQVLMKVYVILGVMMMIGAILYPWISQLFLENRIQAMIFIMGALLSLIGVFANYLYLLRKRRFLELEKLMFDNIRRDKE